jgi:hypothetical protein
MSTASVATISTHARAPFHHRAVTGPGDGEKENGEEIERGQAVHGKRAEIEKRADAATDGRRQQRARCSESNPARTEFSC